jgi:acetylornithine deacetylase/succinyl-diaminopimelate desuccinylase-like protein
MSLTVSDVSERPVELLRQLIRYDTTNPPGNEEECIRFVQSLLAQAGIDATLLTKVSGRPNLIARLPGEGHAPPLLLCGHVDVVTAANQNWTHPPFEARVTDGYVWGRGALDMKGGVTMMLSAFLRAREENLRPSGDVILALLSDEEAGGENGARFLAEKHPEAFRGVRHAIGEFGGFPLYDGENKYYAIQIAEKEVCWLKATIRGTGGHGSLPVRGGAMARLAHLLKQLNENRLAVRITAPVREMIRVMAEANPPLSKLLEPASTDALLDALGPAGLLFDAMLHNTVNATVVQGGVKTNVIPSEISLELDGRIVPGSSYKELVEELRGLVGDDVAFEPLQHEPGSTETDLELFPMLEDILRKADPGARTVPMLLPATTDARHLARLGIQTYGFLPMNLPPEVDFSQTIHGPDERIPVTALDFGTEAIYKVLERYGR